MPPRTKPKGVKIAATIEIGEKRIAVYVDERGWFEATLNGALHNARSLDDLTTKLRRANTQAKIRLDIEATLVDDGAPVPIVLTGRNQRTRAITIRRLDTNKADAVETWSSRNNVLRRLTDAERREFLALHAAMERATIAYNHFVKPRTIDAGKLVDEAIEEAEKAIGAA
jgi:hypothetical protein